MTATRTSTRLGAIVSSFIEERVQDESVEWDVVLSAEMEHCGEEDHHHFAYSLHACFYLALDTPEDGSWISASFGMPIAIATDERVLAELDRAWDSIVFRRMTRGAT